MSDQLPLSFERTESKPLFARTVHPRGWSFATQLVSCDACGRKRDRCRIEQCDGEFTFLCDHHPLSPSVIHPVRSASHA